MKVKVLRVKNNPVANIDIVTLVSQNLQALNDTDGVGIVQAQGFTLVRENAFKYLVCQDNKVLAEVDNKPF